MKLILRVSTTTAILAWLAACAPPPPPSAAPALSPGVQATAGAPAVAASPAPASAQPGANPTLVSGSLWLNIVSPQDQAVVNVAQIELVGQAPANTVISVNDQILIVGPEGQFTVGVPLVEGPNVIEIIASDAGGNEIDTNVTVFYQP